MPSGRRRFGFGAGKPAASKRSSVYGYTLRGKYGRIDYVGVTNDPERRAREHRKSGKRGTLKIETRPMSKQKTARRWEGNRLSTYRRNHAGWNPRYNRTRSGGWRA